MADITLKNLTDIPVVEEASNNTHLLAEQDGAYARVPKDKVGVMSWNDLPDRPFGEEKTVIEWDRDVSAGPVDEFAGTSDLYLGYEGDVPNLATGEVVTVWMCGPGGPSADDPGLSMEVPVTNTGDGIIAGISNYDDISFVICTVDGYSNDALGTLPKKGVYFKARPYDGSASYYIYKIERESIAQLDTKYLSGAPYVRYVVWNTPMMYAQTVEPLTPGTVLNWAMGVMLVYGVEENCFYAHKFTDNARYKYTLTNGVWNESLREPLDS